MGAASFPGHSLAGLRHCTTRRLAAILSGLTPLAVALAACSSGQPAAHLPSKSTPITAPSSARSPTSPSPGASQAAVIAAYTAYFPVSKAAEAAPAAQAEGILAPYAAQPYLGHVLAQMATYRTQHEVLSGTLVPHVTQVHVSGPQATVHDCQDASQAGLADSVTGKVIPGTTGSARTYLIATLSRGTDGRWRLTSLSHVAVSCEPVPSPSS